MAKTTWHPWWYCLVSGVTVSMIEVAISLLFTSSPAFYYLISPIYAINPNVHAGTPWKKGTLVYNALYHEEPVVVERDYELNVPMGGNKDAKLYTANSELAAS